MATLETLRELGLNQLEAEVYTHLLSQAEPETAYRVGKALGKATANVYKAIEALALKGAVTLEQGEPRRCRAAPVDEFLGQLERQFREQKQRAAEELRDLQPAAAQERIYQLRTVPAVLERASAMLQRASKMAVVDAFPETLEGLRQQLQETAARGVEVYVQAYDPVDLAGCQVTLTWQHERVRSFWRSQQLNVAVDAREALLALLHEDLSEVHQALWTDSLYLACLLHAGLGMEQTYHAIAELHDQHPLPPPFAELLERQRFFHNTELPGQRQLFRRLGMAPERTRS